MKIFYQDNQIKSICWDRDYSLLDVTKIEDFSILEIDENMNNPVTCDIAKWWNRGKYYIETGELYQDDDWVEPIEELPIINPHIDTEDVI